MIVEYVKEYDEDIKDLFVELQKAISDIDKERYIVVTEEYREEYFKEVMKLIKDKNGKILLYIENQKAIGVIVGIVNNEKESTFDFKAPKRGRITELVVSKESRGKGIGKKLLKEMSDYLKSIGCEKILIEVFGYNERAIKFYKNNGYHIRMIDMIED